MSDQTIGMLAGMAATGGLLGLLGWIGLFRWWRRRRHSVQLLLLVLLPLLLAALIIAASVVLMPRLEFIGGLLLTSVWTLVLPLLATSHLVRRVRGLDDGDGSNGQP